MIQRLQAKRNEEGFTLIELLIVIIVLGILAAIVVFAVGSTRSDAVESSCKTASKSVELAAEALNTKTGAYPAATNSANAAGSTMLSTNGGLLKAWPSDSDYIINWNGNAVEVYNKANHTAMNTATPPAAVVLKADNTAAAPASCSAGL